VHASEGEEMGEGGGRRVLRCSFQHRGQLPVRAASSSFSLLCCFERKEKEQKKD